MGRKNTEARQVIRRVPSYSDFKDKVDKKGLVMTVEETPKFYLLKAIEGRKLWVHQVWKSSYLDSHTVVGVNVSQEATNQADFESNRKAAAEHDAPTREVNRDGKLFVHQTPTPCGSTSYITSQGDDYTDRASVGGGEMMLIEHASGEGDDDVDIDFNCAGNKTWVYSGFATWASAQRDRLTMSVMSKASTTSGGSSTNFNTLVYPGHPWHGKLIVPAAGDGTLDVTVPVLVGFYPNTTDHEENDVLCYWNATWNPATKSYDDLAAAPAGDGEFNMFTDEMELFRFANQILMDGTNTVPWSIDSRDSQRMGDGMFIRLTPTTNPDVDDHGWRACVTLFMHREQTC